MELATLRALIDSDPDLAALDNTPDNAYAIADVLNQPAGVRITSRFVTARAVLAERGAAGAAVLTKLEIIGASVDVVRWAMRFVATLGEGIDMGHPMTRGMFAQLVAQGALSQGEADTLLSMAEAPSSRALDALGEAVTWQHVCDARSV